MCLYSGVDVYMLIFQVCMYKLYIYVCVYSICLYVYVLCVYIFHVCAYMYVNILCMHPPMYIAYTVHNYTILTCVYMCIHVYTCVCPLAVLPRRELCLCNTVTYLLLRHGSGKPCLPWNIYMGGIPYCPLPSAP